MTVISQSRLREIYDADRDEWLSDPTNEELAAMVSEILSLRIAVDLAVSRGCDHCSEAIRIARRIALIGALEVALTPKAGRS